MFIKEFIQREESEKVARKEEAKQKREGFLKAILERFDNEDECGANRTGDTFSFSVIFSYEEIDKLGISQDFALSDRWARMVREELFKANKISDGTFVAKMLYKGEVMYTLSVKASSVA